MNKRRSWTGGGNNDVLRSVSALFEVKQGPNIASPARQIDCFLMLKSERNLPRDHRSVLRLGVWKGARGIFVELFEVRGTQYQELAECFTGKVFFSLEMLEMYLKGEELDITNIPESVAKVFPPLFDAIAEIADEEEGRPHIDVAVVSSHVDDEEDAPVSAAA